MITSWHNRHVAGALRLKKRALRNRDSRFLVEGVQGVAEALRAPVDVHRVFVLGDQEHAAQLAEICALALARSIPVHPISPEVMARLTSTVTPQGVVAVAGFVDVTLESVAQAGGFLPVLVEVRDPGNAGTIVRSADASGAAAVVVSSSSVDVYNPKAVRATAGSLFHVPIVREADVERVVGSLRRRHFRILAAVATGDESIYGTDLSGSVAVLLGNEARGLGAPAVSLADSTVRVPIAGRAESLNLAAAATIIMFECARQRASPHPSP